jgi:hypothetical protein
MDTNLAWARFLRTLATAANQLATDLSQPVTQPLYAEATADLSPEALAGGERQRSIVVLPGLREEDGLKTAEIAQAIGRKHDEPNIYQALQALRNRGLVELIPNRDPQRWRLVERFRRQPAA